MAFVQSKRAGLQEAIDKAAELKAERKSGGLNYLTVEAGKYVIVRLLSDVVPILVHSFVETSDKTKSEFVCATELGRECILCQKLEGKSESTGKTYKKKPKLIGIAVGVLREEISKTEKGRAVYETVDKFEKDESGKDVLPVQFLKFNIDKQWDQLERPAQKAGRTLVTQDIEISRKGVKLDTVYTFAAQGVQAPLDTVEAVEAHYEPLVGELPDIDGWIESMGSIKRYNEKLSDLYGGYIEIEDEEDGEESSAGVGSVNTAKSEKATDFEDELAAQMRSQK